MRKKNPWELNTLLSYVASRVAPVEGKDVGRARDGLDVLTEGDAPRSLVVVLAPFAILAIHLADVVARVFRVADVKDLARQDVLRIHVFQLLWILQESLEMEHVGRSDNFGDLLLFWVAIDGQQKLTRQSEESVAD